MDYEKDLPSLATELFNCQEDCRGVRCDRERGIVPRYFGISPPLDSRGKIVAIICGKNPGRTPMGEGLWWKSIIARNGDIYEAYNEYVNFGRGFSDIYFYLPYEAAKRHELTGIGNPVIYFTNVAKCENLNGPITTPILEKCRDEYLSKEIDILLGSNLVNKETHVFLLGKDAFNCGRDFFKQRGFTKINANPKPHPCRGYPLIKKNHHKRDYYNDWGNSNL